MKTTLIFLLGLAVSAHAATPEVRITVQTDSPGAAIPADFLGLSYEPPLLATDHFDPTNRVMVQLLHNLGTGVLRFGGNSVEHTFWSRDRKATSCMTLNRISLSPRGIIIRWQEIGSES